MGAREDRLLAEKLQNMADMGMAPAELTPVGAQPAEEPEPAWSPNDIVTADGPGAIAEPQPPVVTGPLEAGVEPIPDMYVGLRNGSIGAGVAAALMAEAAKDLQPEEPAVTPAEERMIFGVPINRTVAEVEGDTHGSPELDEDAAKLEAMGQDLGPTIQDLEAAAEAAIDEAFPDPDFAEVDEPAPTNPAWAAGDLCIYADGLAEIIGVDEEDGLIYLDEVWPTPLKGGFKWERQRQREVDPAAIDVVTTDIGKLLAEAYRQHKAARAAEDAANAAHAASDRLIKAHFALADASVALAEIGQTIAVTPAA